jgi:hypothetical protein
MIEVGGGREKKTGSKRKWEVGRGIRDAIVSDVSSKVSSHDRVCLSG